MASQQWKESCDKADSIGFEGPVHWRRVVTRMRDASRQWLRPIVFGTQQLVYPPTVMPQETIRVPIDASEFSEVHFWLVRENGRNEVIAYAERWIDTLRETNGKDLQKTLARARVGTAYPFLLLRSLSVPVHPNWVISRTSPLAGQLGTAASPEDDAGRRKLVAPLVVSILTYIFTLEHTEPPPRQEFNRNRTFPALCIYCRGTRPDTDRSHYVPSHVYMGRAQARHFPVLFWAEYIAGAVFPPQQNAEYATFLAVLLCQAPEHGIPRLPVPALVPLIGAGGGPGGGGPGGGGGGGGGGGPGGGNDDMPPLERGDGFPGDPRGVDRLRGGGSGGKHEDVDGELPMPTDTQPERPSWGKRGKETATDAKKKSKR